MSLGNIYNFLKDLLTGGDRGASSFEDRPIIIREDVRTFGTKEYWSHRQKALWASVLELLERTGDPGKITLVRETRTCLGELQSDAVKQNPLLLLVVEHRCSILSALVARTAMTDLPGGKAILEEVLRCSERAQLPDYFAEEPHPEPERDQGEKPAPAEAGGAGSEHSESESEEPEVCSYYLPP